LPAKLGGPALLVGVIEGNSRVFFRVNTFDAMLLMLRAARTAPSTLAQTIESD